jgi:crotonobetaine/carnitine-CoA ligase
MPTAIPATIDDRPLEIACDPRSVATTCIRDWAAREPRRPFFTEVGGRSLDYGDFHRELLQWCTWLSAQGVGPGDRVGSFLPASIDACMVWLAAGLIGALEVPFNPALRGEFLRHQLRDAAPRLLLARPEASEWLAPALQPGQRLVAVPRDASPVAGETPAVVERYPQPDDIACVIYTSGTTGAAKGVEVPWAEMNSTLGRIPLNWLNGDDAVYAPWPMFHVTGRTPVVSMAYYGGRVVSREGLSVSHFWSDIREYGCTSTTVGTAVPLLLAQPEAPGDRDNPLRIAFGNAAGAMNVEFQRRFDVRLILTYGSTEAGFFLINRQVDADSCDTVGRPRPGYEVKVIDTDGNPVADGEPGELCVRPPAPAMIFAGYLNNPAATAAAKRDGWYHTGDAVRRLADGTYRFVDRIKDTIRRFGENISGTALEVEINRQPLVEESCVLPVPSAISGHEIALLVTSRAEDFSAEELFDALAKTLPRHMLPSYIGRLEAFPKTPTGKVQKALLRETLNVATLWMTPAANAAREG